MANRSHQIIALVFVLILAAACASTPTSTPSPTIVTPPTTVPPTLIETASAPSNPPPTIAPTTVPPTPTVSSATATNPPPATALPPTEEVETDTNQDNSNMTEANKMQIRIGDNILTATLVENSSVDAMKEALSEGPITVDMRDYGSMEKVGPLGTNLPRNDQQITTEAGDIILYQGNALVIYYAPNSWSFTRLGKIDDVSAQELKEILGDGNVTITLSLPQE